MHFSLEKWVSHPMSFSHVAGFYLVEQSLIWTLTLLAHRFSLLFSTHMTHQNSAPSPPEIGKSFKAKTNPHTTLPLQNYSLFLSLIISLTSLFFIHAMKRDVSYILSFIFICAMLEGIFSTRQWDMFWKMELLIPFKNPPD